MWSNAKKRCWTIRGSSTETNYSEHFFFVNVHLVIICVWWHQTCVWSKNTAPCVCVRCVTASQYKCRSTVPCTERRKTTNPPADGLIAAPLCSISRSETLYSVSHQKHVYIKEEADVSEVSSSLLELVTSCCSTPSRASFLFPSLVCMSCRTRSCFNVNVLLLLKGNIIKVLLICEDHLDEPVSSINVSSFSVIIHIKWKAAVWRPPVNM